MKLSTRARYGLRMMIELARLQKRERLVQLHRIAKITGLSNNYLAQLALSLKDDGLVIGVSGKKGGYYLARPPEQIRISEIVKAVQGPVFATECVVNPDLCLNAEFCEGRVIWAILAHQINQALDQFTLADVIDENWINNMKEKYLEVPNLFIGRMMDDSIENSRGILPGACQQSTRAGYEEEID